MLSQLCLDSALVFHVVMWCDVVLLVGKEQMRRSVEVGKRERGLLAGVKAVFNRTQDTEGQSWWMCSTRREGIVGEDEGAPRGTGPSWLDASTVCWMFAGQHKTSTVLDLFGTTSRHSPVAPLLISSGRLSPSLWLL